MRYVNRHGPPQSGLATHATECDRITAHAQRTVKPVLQRPGRCYIRSAYNFAHTHTHTYRSFSTPRALSAKEKPNELDRNYEQSCAPFDFSAGSSKKKKRNSTACGALAPWKLCCRCVTLRQFPIRFKSTLRAQKNKHARHNINRFTRRLLCYVPRSKSRRIAPQQTPPQTVASCELFYGSGALNALLFSVRHRPVTAHAATVSEKPLIWG